MARRKAPSAFAPIKKQIVSAHKKLRKKAKATKSKALRRKLHSQSKVLASAHAELGFGKLANFEIV